MALTSEEVIKIQNEATLDVEPSITTPEALEFRKKIEPAIKQAMAEGKFPHAPFEL